MVAIPRRADMMGPMVEPHGESLRTTKSCNGTPDDNMGENSIREVAIEPHHGYIDSKLNQLLTISCDH